MQVITCIMGRERDGPGLQGAGRPDQAAPARPSARAQRSDAARAVRAAWPWPASRPPSISTSSWRPTSSPSCGEGGSGCTTSTRRRSTRSRSAGSRASTCPGCGRSAASRHRAEEHAMTSVPTYVYVTYIHATAEQVWRALTDADLTARYWGHANVSDWQPGSAWEHRRVDGSGVNDVVGKVLEAEPPTRLVHHLRGRPEAGGAGSVGRHVPRRAAPGHRPPHRDPREPRRHGRCSTASPAAGRPCWRTSSPCSRPATSSRRRRGRCPRRTPEATPDDG